MIISGNTLVVKHESGNIGHFFNDHVYSSFAYFLEHETEIDNVYITNSEPPRKDVSLWFLERKFRDGKSKGELNFNMILLFFLNTTKNVYFKGDCNYTIETPIYAPSDRFFTKHINYISVFSQLLANYEQYTIEQKIESTRIDVSVLYRTTSKTGRNIKNIELLSDLCKQKNLSYRLLDTSNYYTFFEIIDVFHNSDNIISIHGCELTYGFFMQANKKILELTPTGHVERWWSEMQKKYVSYGLQYERIQCNFTEGDLILTEAMCHLLYGKLCISYYDNFVSLGERCDTTIALHNIHYKKSSFPFDYVISKMTAINQIVFEDKSFDSCIDISTNSALEAWKSPNYCSFRHHNQKKDQTIDEYRRELKYIFNKKLATLYDIIRSNKRILFIYTYKSICNHWEQLFLFCDNLKRSFDYTNYRILAITENPMPTNIYPISNINYKLDRTKQDGFQGTDYGDAKIRQFIERYVSLHYYCYGAVKHTVPKPPITNIVSLGSRCINAGIYDRYNYKKFSNIFDFIDIKTLKNVYTTLITNFNDLLDKRNLKRVQFGAETKTSNIQFDNGVRDLTFPHHNLFDERTEADFNKKKTTFKKHRYFNTLFVFTVTNVKHSYSEIQYWSRLIEQYFEHQGYMFTLLVVNLIENDATSERSKCISHENNVYIYDLFYHKQSFTGGVFLNDIDNEEYKKIIDSIKTNKLFVMKDEIDSIMVL